MIFYVNHHYKANSRKFSYVFKTCKKDIKLIEKGQLFLIHLYTTELQSQIDDYLYKFFEI